MTTQRDRYLSITTESGRPDSGRVIRYPQAQIGCSMANRPTRPKWRDGSMPTKPQVRALRLRTVPTRPDKRDDSPANP